MTYCLAGHGEVEGDVALSDLGSEWGLYSMSRWSMGLGGWWSAYHGDCHDGGIGDEDCSVQVSAVGGCEHDVEGGDVEAFEFVQAFLFAGQNTTRRKKRMK